MELFKVVGTRPRAAGGKELAYELEMAALKQLAKDISRVASLLSINLADIGKNIDAEELRGISERWRDP